MLDLTEIRARRPEAIAEAAATRERYYEVARGGFAYQRVYDGMDLLAEVRTGDTIEVPCGYHGPSMAAPGYDLYSLDVMAGEVREWNFVDDPDHAWIRASWTGQELDPRVPMTHHRGAAAPRIPHLRRHA